MVIQSLLLSSLVCGTKRGRSVPEASCCFLHFAFNARRVGAHGIEGGEREGLERGGEEGTFPSLIVTVSKMRDSEGHACNGWRGVVYN